MNAAQNAWTNLFAVLTDWCNQYLHSLLSGSWSELAASDSYDCPSMPWLEPPVQDSPSLLRVRWLGRTAQEMVAVWAYYVRWVREVLESIEKGVYSIHGLKFSYGKARREIVTPKMIEENRKIYNFCRTTILLERTVPGIAVLEARHEEWRAKIIR